MRFSLIVATVGRTAELEAFFGSLSSQTHQDFEVIVVDQNSDARILPIIDRARATMPVHRIHSALRNSSHARNLGIALVRGDIVAFPDDDCLYPASLLETVDSTFNNDHDLTVLVGPSIGPTGQLGSGRWQTKSGTPTMQSIWTSVIEFNLFIKADALQTTRGFDEDLGVGAVFGSSEGVDLAIRTMKSGCKIYYDYSLRVVHPDKKLTSTAVARAFRYGMGMGRVMRKHMRDTGAATILNFMIRPAGGVAVNTLKANFLAASYYWHTLRGRVSGFVAKT